MAEDLKALSRKIHHIPWLLEVLEGPNANKYLFAETLTWLFCFFSGHGRLIQA